MVMEAQSWLEPEAGRYRALQGAPCRSTAGGGQVTSVVALKGGANRFVARPIVRAIGSGYRSALPFLATGGTRGGPSRTTDTLSAWFPGSYSCNKIGWGAHDNEILCACPTYS